tara:strand:+ start:1300 stop:1530 length:231 start_codon:yes stop_codon:yes gene_type:complete
MLEISKTKLKIIAYRLRDAEKILDSYGNTNSLSDWRLKEAQLIMTQASQDLLHIIEGTELKDVEKEIDRLQRSLAT